MKTIIAGHRDFYDDKFLYKVMYALKDWGITEVVSGCARGADTLGEEWAKEHMIPVAKFPALWAKYKLAAGPIRNKQMAEYGDALVAFLAPDSKGTANMIAQFRKLKPTAPLCVVYIDMGTWVIENVSDN